MAGGRTFRLPNLKAHLHRGLTMVAIAMNSNGHVKKIIAGHAPSAIDAVCWILETEGCEAEYWAVMDSPAVQEALPSCGQYAEVV